MQQTIGIGNLLQTLFTGKQDTIATGSTTTVINASTITSVANQWQSSYIFFVGGANNGQFAQISSNTATSFTLSSTLPHTPVVGDQYLIFLGTQVNVTVSAPENIAQWDGTAVAPPLDDASDGVATATGGIPRILARLTAWTGAAWSRLKLAASGSLQTKDDATGTAGVAAGTTVIQVGGSDGTNLRALSVDDSGRQIITATGTLTDISGTITTGGTAQTLAAANANRKYLLIQNNSSAALWFNFTATAVTSEPSLQLAVGGSFVMETGLISTEAISIIGATTGQAFSAKEG